eukprot:TRINITY_DN1096_c0_g1_i2.p1 TRINITY_DN1096_c0_g1~~TRINITY_DN1096_c0_g1_i2.p1  ORF type:complete len:191 (+),score=74.03 TRINITY_DN1096_c0_g1_i2:328-900(+)
MSDSRIEEIVDGEEVIAKVEEVDSDDQQVEDLETEQVTPGKYKQTRSEKKARKAVAKLGLTTVSDVERVTIRKGHEVNLNIPRPDVYATANGKTYVIFGEAKMDQDGLSGADWSNLAAGLEGGMGDEDDVPPELVEAEATEVTDASDELIDLVLGQVPGASREAAAAALQANNNDVVSAVFNLKVANQEE